MLFMNWHRRRYEWSKEWQWTTFQNIKMVFATLRIYEVWFFIWGSWGSKLFPLLAIYISVEIAKFLKTIVNKTQINSSHERLGEAYYARPLPPPLRYFRSLHHCRLLIHRCHISVSALKSCNFTNSSIVHFYPTIRQSCHHTVWPQCNQHNRAPRSPTKCYAGPGSKNGLMRLRLRLARWPLS